MKLSTFGFEPKHTVSIRPWCLVPICTSCPQHKDRFGPNFPQPPEAFTLYGGTALALRFGHRTSNDFDFFSNDSFDPERLAQQIPYLKNAERLQVAPDTLTCRIDRGGAVLISFFGGLGLGQVASRDEVTDMPLHVASLLDIDALLEHGIDLPTVLAAGLVVYGRQFNPLITLKALGYFDDVVELPDLVQARLTRAVEGVDVSQLPALTPYARRPGEDGSTP